MFRLSFISLILTISLASAAPAQENIQDTIALQSAFTGRTFQASLNGRTLNWKIATKKLQVLIRQNHSVVTGYVTYYGNVVVAENGAAVFAQCNSAGPLEIRGSDDTSRQIDPPCPGGQPGPITIAYKKQLEESTFTTVQLDRSTSATHVLFHERRLTF